MADKFKINDEVVNIYSGERGVIRERKVVNDSVRWKVFISQQNQPWVKEDYLELVQDKPLADLFLNGQFLGLQELKRILSFIRIKGDVTNIYYSMNNGATKFLAYQFKPVLKFIESTTGRLLIADEVGLGKTIEAMYIWQELVARENSRRLLIVCPATLCEKWKKDMYNFFSIEASIVNAEGVLENLKEAAQLPGQKHFALITSLEGIRFREKEDKTVKKSAKQLLGELLTSRSSNNDFPLIDMLIVDEVHNIRNTSAVGHKTVELIRDNSGKVILLSATPIQTHESNLFSILKILDPDVFFDKKTFETQLEEGQNYIITSNLLRAKASFEDFIEPLVQIKNGPMYAQDPTFIDEFQKNLVKILKDDRLRLDYFEKFAQKVFYSNYFTRTRKCDAVENIARRQAVTFKYQLDESYEKRIYEDATHVLNELASTKDTFGGFQIIGRQRQMASCMYAAFEDWMNKKETFLDEYDLEDDGYSEFEHEFSLQHQDLYDLVCKIDVDLARLEREDSKYNKVLESIRNQQKNFPDSKIILFSFYRNTISYLQRRFTEDGISCISLMGGGSIDKNEVLRQFREDPNIKILLSTEVGSEGLDLQFCDTEINYDLPWNPMRLEQRIGRIDRIGQNAEKLNIINIACEDSVEDKVLMRLYDRIDIFKNSIGDIDEILGNTTNDIALVLMNNKLTTEEKEKQAADLINTACMKKKLQEDLEKNAANFQAFQEYIIKNVNEAQQTQRFVRTVDLMFYVKDFLCDQWPGCEIEEYPFVRDALMIKLSHQAATKFGDYLKSQGMNSQLRLSTESTLCLFDSSQKDAVRKKSFEIISYTHPIVKWITEERSNVPTSNYGCSSVTFHSDPKSLPKTGKGMYSYFVQQWRAKGFKKKNELKFYLCHIDSQEIVSPLLAEEILTKTFMFGDSNPRWSEECNLDDAYDALDLLLKKADEEFSVFENEFDAGNKDFCNQQKIALETTAARKREQLNTVIQNLRNEGKEAMAKLNEAQLKAVNKRLKNQSMDVDNQMHTECENHDVCMGILKID